MIKRSIRDSIENVQKTGKAIVLQGARQVGKTTLLKELFARVEGQLWENFVVSEFYKKTAYANKGARLYFWRDKRGAEVDLVVGENGRYSAFELKFNPRKKVRFPKAFSERYTPEST